MHVCVCTHMLAWCLHTCRMDMCVCVEARGGHQMSFASMLHLISLVLCLSEHIARLAAKPRDTHVCHSHMQLWLIFFVRCMCSVCALLFCLQVCMCTMSVLYVHKSHQVMVQILQNCMAGSPHVSVCNQTCILCKRNKNS